MPKYHYAECVHFCLRARLMYCCRAICWCRCPCFSVLTSRREAKPKSVRERDVKRNCAPECDVTRTRSRFTCSETSLLLHVATWALTNRRIDTSKWHDTSPLTTFANKSERTLPNDVLAQGRGDYRLQISVIFASVFAFISHCDVHGMTLRELTGYTWKSRRVTCSLPWTMLQRTQILMTSHPLVLFYTYTFYV